ncbi:PREDICTED: nudix hydrolase 18, mitochondrial-like [Nelumbo nucifera]|uniref:Nudix hydrolase 18, mitochondrial-like n=1 Tax=Nelumbo nucifera TaxID=4432 RepID=A0A1U8ATH2_NELNU|nr:PREDICTED: nudix hydrolase 18, mitochondrial-like [Nelumbo nucifera]
MAVVDVLVSRTGRDLQRYDEVGRRQVVGCIPYRCNNPSNDADINDLEVLMISSQKKRHIMLFPKGGWEQDESIVQAAERETYEEAGVTGTIKTGLGRWLFKSKRFGSDYEGYMYPLLVEKLLDNWPEKNVRQRKWMTVDEAKKSCPHDWMIEALEELVLRLQQKGN